MDEEVKLANCPFCGGVAGWCDQQPLQSPEEEPHECHQITCTECHLNADMAPAGDPDNNAETLDDLRRRCAIAWNRRAALAPATGREG